jgi:hypothetical protein
MSTPAVQSRASDAERDAVEKPARHLASTQGTSEPTMAAVELAYRGPVGGIRLQRQEAGGGPASDPGAAPSSFLVEDGAVPNQAGGMEKGAFFSLLRGALEGSLREDLAGTAYTPENCPYLAHWLDHYESRPAAEVERAVRLYLGAGPADTAAGYAARIADRVRGGVRRWLLTGEVAVPARAAAQEAPQGEAGGDEGAVRMFAEGGLAAGAARPGEVRRALGPGTPLPGATRTQMERAFGTGFDAVRVHADERAGRMARGFGARAFAVGEHVAFAPGRFAPGTVRGDLLLAHELAHTVQQRGAGARAPARADDGPALEREADGAAVAAVTERAGRSGEVLPPGYQAAAEQVEEYQRERGFPLRSGAGLRLQRCQSSEQEPPAPTPTQTPAPAPPAPKWFQEAPVQAGGRTVFVRDVRDFVKLQQLLRRVNVIITGDTRTEKQKLKKGPGDKASEFYIVGQVAKTQWTTATVEKKIDKIFPPGKDTFVGTGSPKIGEVEAVVESERKSSPQTFSMLQGVQSASCAFAKNCILDFATVMRELYGSRTVQPKELGDDVQTSMAALKKKKLSGAEKTFAAEYVGSADRFQILDEDADVKLSGAGKWVVDQAVAAGEGVHAFALSLSNGFHSVSVFAHTGPAGTSVIWRDQFGSNEVSPAEFDKKVRNMAKIRFRFLMRDKFNEKHGTKHNSYDDIKDDPLTPAIENEHKPTVVKDMGLNKLLKLKPPEP